jgi:hypothetical protein
MRAGMMPGLTLCWRLSSAAARAFHVTKSAGACFVAIDPLPLRLVGMPNPYHSAGDRPVTSRAGQFKNAFVGNDAERSGTSHAQRSPAAQRRPAVKGRRAGRRGLHLVVSMLAMTGAQSVCMMTALASTGEQLRRTRQTRPGWPLTPRIRSAGLFLCPNSGHDGRAPYGATTTVDLLAPSTSFDRAPSLPAAVSHVALTSGLDIRCYSVTS